MLQIQTSMKETFWLKISLKFTLYFSWNLKKKANAKTSLTNPQCCENLIHYNSFATIKNSTTPSIKIETRKNQTTPRTHEIGLKQDHHKQETTKNSAVN